VAARATRWTGPTSVTTRLLNTNRTADFLGVRPKTLAKWRVYGGGPPFVRLGGRVMYDVTDLEKYVAALPRHRSTADTAAQGAPHSGNST
jgi:hypothetical protein